MDATRRAGQATVVLGALLVIAGLAWGLADSVRDALGDKRPQLVVHEAPPPGPHAAPAPDPAIAPAPEEGWPFTGSTLRYTVNLTTRAEDRSLTLEYAWGPDGWACAEGDALPRPALPAAPPPRLAPGSGPPAAGGNLTVSVPFGGCRTLSRLNGSAEGPVQVVAPLNGGAYAVTAVRVAGGNATAGWEAFHDAETGLLLSAREWRPGLARTLHLVVSDAPLAYVTHASEGT